MYEQDLKDFDRIEYGDNESSAPRREISYISIYRFNHRIYVSTWFRPLILLARDLSRDLASDRIPRLYYRVYPLAAFLKQRQTTNKSALSFRGNYANGVIDRRVATWVAAKITEIFLGKCNERPARLTIITYLSLVIVNYTHKGEQTSAHARA